MKLGPVSTAELAAGKRLRLDLGCGERPKAGFIGVDRVDLPGVDIEADLERPFDLLPSNSVDEVFAQHVLEHVTNFLPLLREIHRVCVPNARVEVISPHFSSPYGMSDPTHVRFFGLYSFFYFADEADQPKRKVPAFYIPERFSVEAVSVTVFPTMLTPKPVRRFISRRLNRSIDRIDRHERTWCRLFPLDSIRYVLRVKK